MTTDIKARNSFRSATMQMQNDQKITIITLTKEAQYRVPKAERGMTFVVDKFTDGGVAHIRDFRYVDAGHDYAIWSLSADMYEIAYAVAL